MNSKPISDLPTLVGVDYRPHEGPKGVGDYVHVVTFAWHGGEYCLFGRMRWRNIMGVPGALVRSTRARKMHQTGFIVHAPSKASP